MNATEVKHIDILITIWCVIDGLMFLLTLPFIRLNISKQEIQLWKRSINRIQRKMERIGRTVKEIFACGFLVIIFYILLREMPNTVIQLLLDWCKGTFIVAFFPILLSWIQMNKNKCGIHWSVLNVFLGVTISIIGYAVDSIDTVIKNKQVIIIFFSIFVTILIFSLYKILITGESGYDIKKIGKEIRKDLYYRTTNLDMNLSQIELIRYSERFFNEYISYLKKMRNIISIEYVTLMGIYKDYWYKRSAKKMRYFVCLNSVILLAILIRNGLSSQIILVCVLIMCFGINISFLKKKDNNYLNKIAIRYFYDEWGYCIYCKQKKCKYVGNVQMIEWWKQHKFIHSFLDIVALCRAVTLDDEIMKTEKIKLLSKNFSELFYIYADDDFSETCKAWIVYLPLWISSLFEYKLFRNIDIKIKCQLKCSLKDGEDWNGLHIFLQSFIVDMTRQMPNEENVNLVSEFCTSIRDVTQ